MKKILSKIIVALMIIASISNIALAHPGRTDSHGGHTDKSTGIYHYHNSGTSKPIVTPTPKLTPRPTPKPTLKPTPAPISVNLNGSKIIFADQNPVIVDGRTLVPLRKIFEKLGAEVTWYAQTRTIIAKKGTTTVEVKIDNKKAKINGKEVTIEVPAVIINGRTLVPVRFISESFGSKVDWDSNTKTVTIAENNAEDIFAGYRKIEVDGGNLSGHREAKVVVDIGFGDRKYYAFTNSYGQLFKVVAEKITLQDASKEKVLENGRYYKDEAKVPGVESSTLDEGHVIADSLGGVSNSYNITPQNSTLNRYGNQAYMEKIIRDAGDGGCTNFTCVITYPNVTTQIPSRYSYTYTLKGNIINDEFDNVNPEKK